MWRPLVETVLRYISTFLGLLWVGRVDFPYVSKIHTITRQTQKDKDTLQIQFHCHELWRSSLENWVSWQYVWFKTVGWSCARAHAAGRNCSMARPIITLPFAVDRCHFCSWFGSRVYIPSWKIILINWICLQFFWQQWLIPQELFPYICVVRFQYHVLEKVFSFHPQIFLDIKNV